MLFYICVLDWSFAAINGSALSSCYNHCTLLSLTHISEIPHRKVLSDYWAKPLFCDHVFILYFAEFCPLKNVVLEKAENVSYLAI
jgi:hypothetical protein